VREIRTVPDRPAPGPAAGAVLGALAGLLLSWLWLDRSRDVALAVTFVFAGLVAAVVGGAPTWRRFGLGMLAAVLVVGAGLAVLLS
jgi:hypothetical protein